jgi:hypothetical protein
VARIRLVPSLLLVKTMSIAPTLDFCGCSLTPCMFRLLKYRSKIGVSNTVVTDRVRGVSAWSWQRGELDANKLQLTNTRWLLLCVKVAHSAIQPAKDAETNGQRVDVRLVFSVVLVIFWRCAPTKSWFIYAGVQFVVTAFARTSSRSRRLVPIVHQ